ncbi:MAG: hypothetical protein IT335_10140 [Thermomicrobiales bacterium]|jgi:hypothetical protein|nr:hypothetical protein [Thermomicrobiales bacterium]
MDRNSMLVLDLAMMEHQEMVRNTDRRQMLRDVSRSRQGARFAGVRRMVGRSLISAGEWIHIDESGRQADELAGDNVSMSLSC